MNAIFSALSPDSGSKTRLRLAAMTLAALALLLAAGWLLWPSEPAHAQDISRKSLVHFFAYVEDDVKLSLEALGMTGGVAIEPEFSPDHYSYTMTVPYQEVGFRGKFISPYVRGYKNWGFVVVNGDLEEYERLTNRASHGTTAFDTKERMILANSGRSTRDRYFTLQPDVAETIQIGVYRWRSRNTAGERMPGSIFKTVYTLKVNYEPPAEDDTGLYDLTISDGWLDFDPFDTDATSYTVYVARDTESVVLTPTTLHPDATATVKGGAPANAVALHKGGNIIPVVVTAADGNTTQTYSVTVYRGATHDHSAFVAKMYKWRNNPEWARYKAHRDRWDRALLAFGETVADTTMTPLTSAEAQSFADRGSAWHRWVSVADALRDIESSREKMEEQEQERQSQEAQELGRLPSPSTDDTDPQDSDPPNRAPVVSSALPDVAGLKVGATREVSLSGVFSDSDGDSLTISAGSSNESVATVSVASGGSSLTVAGVAEGPATITVAAQDGEGNSVSDAFDVAVVGKYADLIAKMYEWLTDPEWKDNKEHTDRWDRALLAFGEAVEDTTLTAMTAAEAQGFADRGWERWVAVAAALRELENQPPTVSGAIADVTIVHESGTKEVSLSGVFDDADNDALTVSAASSDGAIATVSVAADYSSLTVSAQARGAATVTVTADDGNGGTVEDAFTVTVKAAPVVAQPLDDVSGLEVEMTQEVSLVGVFSDADGDQLTITAASGDETRATVTVAPDGSGLTLSGVAEGTTTVTVTAEDSDGNRVSDAFQVEVVQRFASLIPRMYQWRNDPEWNSQKAHTDRWDRALLAFGETVADTSLTPMTAAEAQGFADRGWERWVEVAAALKEIEGGGQRQPNRAPTVSGAIADATIVSESGTHAVSLAGVFSDGDNDALTITAGSDDEAVATVSVASDYSTLTATAKSRGTATITVTAEDGRGGTVEDTFTVRVKAAPTVSAAIADVSGLEAGDTQEVSLSGVFSDADGDGLTVTAASSDAAKATVSVALDYSTLTLTGVAEGTATITVTARDSDWNRVSDAFDVPVAAPQPQQPPATPNRAPTVSAAIGDAIIVHESGTKQVSLSGVFEDADNDSLTVSAASSDGAVATVSVAADYSSLTVNAQGRGTATVTVTSNDGNGGAVEDSFTVTVKAAPTVSAAIADVSGLEAGSTQDVSLAGVFSDADGDALTISAASGDEAVATVSVAPDGSGLTLSGVAEGTTTVTVTAQDSDGNRVSDTFDVAVEPEPEPDPPPDGETANRAPTVAQPLPDVSLEELQWRQFSLPGVFHDPDGDELTFTVVSSDYGAASVWVSGSTLTVVAKSTGTATITVTAEDGDGNRVSDAFKVTVTPAS